MNWNRKCTCKHLLKDHDECGICNVCDCHEFIPKNKLTNFKEIKLFMDKIKEAYTQSESNFDELDKIALNSLPKYLFCKKCFLPKGHENHKSQFGPVSACEGSCDCWDNLPPVCEFKSMEPQEDPHGT